MKNNPLRVAWFCQYDIHCLAPHLPIVPPYRYHASSWIVSLAREMTHSSNVELHIITLSPHIRKSTSIVNDNIHFHVLKTGIPLCPRPFPNWLPLNVLTCFVRERSLLNRKVRQINPDIIHAHGTEYAYALAACRARFPFLVSIQGILTHYYKANPTPHQWCGQWMEQWAIHRTKYFGCRTEFDTHFVREINPNAIIFTLQEIVNHLFFERCWTPPHTSSFLTVGEISGRKGTETVIRAFSLIHKEIPDATLFIVGSGKPSYVESLKQLAGRLNILDHVTFTGTLTADKIADLHMRCEMLLFPSFMDNSPNAVAEAMVTGLPVIATRAGGIPSMIKDKHTGMLVDIANPEQLAAAAISLLHNPKEQQRISENSRTVARQRHSPDTVVQQTLTAYRTILSASQTPTPVRHKSRHE
jgi:glycosyltransferase involved in cell wall biosynthesis